MGILDGKVAVITGAARGIGRAIAEELSAAGADLALCDLKAEWLNDTADAVRKNGRKDAWYSVDVSESQGRDAPIS